MRSCLVVKDRSPEIPYGAMVLFHPSALHLHFSLLGWLKLHPNHEISCDWLREISTDGDCIMLVLFPFFVFPRLDFSFWEYRNKFFLVAMCHLIVRRSNFKIETKRLLISRQNHCCSFRTMEKCPDSYFWLYWYLQHLSCYHLGIICYDIWVLSDGHKNYFKDKCLIHSQPTFLIL